MSKPDFEPQAGKVWAVLTYPNGRSEWQQIQPDRIELDIDEAARLLYMMSRVYLPDELQARTALEMMREFQRTLG